MNYFRNRDKRNPDQLIVMIATVTASWLTESWLKPLMKDPEKYKRDYQNEFFIGFDTQFDSLKNVSPIEKIQFETFERHLSLLLYQYLIQEYFEIKKEYLNYFPRDRILLVIGGEGFNAGKEMIAKALTLSDLDAVRKCIFHSNHTTWMPCHFGWIVIKLNEIYAEIGTSIFSKDQDKVAIYS